MAKTLTGVDGTTHLKHLNGGTLCGDAKRLDSDEAEGILRCSECAKIALYAIELSTKAERREWRKL